jgi:hypothetical protein
MLDFIWGAAGLLAWFTGSTMLQTRAKNRPFDIALGLSVLALTMIAFHFEAVVMLANPAQYSGAVVATIFDIALATGAIVMVRKRVLPDRAFFSLSILIFLGSLSFWFWYINLLGGLTPR